MGGCGLSGELSKAWRILTGQQPPFAACCMEHDLAYEQVETDEDRTWADWHLLRCMSAQGWPVLGAVFFVAVRCLGWVAVLRCRRT